MKEEEEGKCKRSKEVELKGGGVRRLEEELRKRRGSRGGEERE